MKNQYKIAGVITLFNPDEKIKFRIEAILPFVEKLFLIDNSDGLNEYLSSTYKGNQKVEYCFNNSNLGIAASMNIAIEKAIAKKFDFLLTMDQDSEFEANSLAKIISAIISDDSIAIYSPFHKNKFFTNPPQSSDNEEIFDVMTSGNLLNLNSVKQVGKFREDYFIDYVDIEFCLRLRKNGFKIIRVNSSILNHNEANLMVKSFWGKKVYPPNHKPFRWYYKIRNFFYLKDEYQSDFPEYFANEKKNIRNNIIKIFLFEKHKFLKMKFIIKGFLDYRKNIRGKLN